MDNMGGKLHAPEWTGKTLRSSTQFPHTPGRQDVFTYKHRKNTMTSWHLKTGPQWWFFLAQISCAIKYWKQSGRKLVSHAT